MYWGPNKQLLRNAAAFVLVAGAATAAAAEVLVVRAQGPSAKNYPAGKSLADNAQIVLKANDSLVLLNSRGTRTLRGPGTFTPSGPAGAAPRSAMAAVASGSGRRARIGAVRGGDVPSPRSIWLVDVGKSSNVCLADPSNVTLWRADASQPVTLTVTRAGDGAKQDVQWTEGESTLEWPSAMTIADGADYNVSWSGAPQATSLKFRTLPAKPVGIEEMASSLIQNGCQAQLDLLIETVKLPDDQSAPAG